MSDTPISKAFKFSGEFAREAKRNIAKYPKGRQQSAVLALLFLAQNQNQQQNADGGRYVTDEAVTTIGEMLSMARLRVIEVASFFTMINLSPVGRYHIQLCGTTPCRLCGAESLRSACEKHLEIECGGTSSDGLFTLSEVECLGACCNAPMVQINDDYYEDLTPQLLLDILDNLRNGKAVRVGSQVGRRCSEPIGWSPDSTETAATGESS